MNNNDPISNIPTSNERWYYAEGEAVNGPFSLPELLKKAEEGILNAETLVVPEGQDDWRPFASIVPTPPAETPPALPTAEVTASAEAAHKNDAPKLRNKFLSATPPPAEQPQPNNKDALKGCGALILLVVAAVALWHYWRLLLCLAGFLGVWYEFASSNLRAKKSKTYSIGGGFVLGLMALLFLKSCVGSDGGEVNYTEQFEPAAAYSPPEVNQRSKAELLALFDELQQFRGSSEFHDYGFSRLGKIGWMNRVKQLQEREAQADDSIMNYIASAANSLESMGMSYHYSKGQETDATRTMRESIEDRTGVSRVVTKRRRSDFERILSGKDETTIGDVSVTNLGDVITETMGERISWTLTERVLLSSDSLEVKLVSFDDGYLYYVTPDSQGRSIPFALRRTPDIEEKTVNGYATQRELYEALMRGEAASVDPLKTGHILVTSGTANFDFSKDKKSLGDYLSATHNKVAQWGFDICRVRVIVVD